MRPPKKVERMNKATKGALAGGAAVVLLLGGAGSYALWSDTETIAGGGAISTGILKLEPVGVGTWTDISPSAPVTPGDLDIAAFNMVPGDVLAYDVTFRVDAEGDNLQATLIPNQASITYGAGVTASEITVATDTRDAGTGAAIPPLLTEANDGQEIDVRVVVTFNAGTTTNVGQNSSVNLAGFQVVLQQTRA
ncbi:alternate-type signal peptide domain-containing protein [Rhodococcoides fascians]|uniref:alternate-type signal peptide domain-containing protein n=2 Tax=Mycobacteriales TaxID=85007 RepID=UPI0009D6D9BC